MAIKRLDWIDGKKVISEMSSGEVAALAAPALTAFDADLSPRAWRFFVEFSGFDDVIEALIASLQKGTVERAAIVANVKNAAIYRFDKVLAMIAENRAAVDLVAPGLDLSEETLSVGWLAARDWDATQ